MSENDLESVLAIETASFARPWTARHFLDEIRSPFGTPLVAVDADAAVVGYLCLKQVLDEAEILDVAVGASRRGLGVGRLLMDRALSDCLARGVRSVALEVRVGNDPALELYRSIGFQETGRRKRYYENGDDAVLMQYNFCTREEHHAV